MDLQETIDSEAKKKKILIILGIALLLIIIGVAVYFLTKPAKGTPTGTLSDFSGLESEERESTSSFALATTIALSTDHTTVSPGQEAIISWTAANATSCVSSAGDEVTLEGAVSVSPNEPYTFEITCTGPNGTDIQSVTIDVTTAPIIELRASPSAVIPGETSTISWKTFNSYRCVNSAGSTLLLTDNFQVSPKKAYTFEMSCTGANGTTKKSVTVGMVSTCENGATNFPSCTTLPDGSCVNGNSNPPFCSAEVSKTCGNSATNFPSCTTLPGGSCVNGNSNPPSCNAEFFGSGNDKDFGKKGNVNAKKPDDAPSITLTPNITIPYDTTTLVKWTINRNANYCIFTSDSPTIEKAPVASRFDGYISGKTLTVTNALNGSVLVGHTLHSTIPGIPRGTTVVGIQSITGNTYTLDVPGQNSTYRFGSSDDLKRMDSRGYAEEGLFGLSPIVTSSGSKTTSRMRESRKLNLTCSNRDNVKVSSSMTITVEPKPIVATTTIKWYGENETTQPDPLYKGVYERIDLKWTATDARSCALMTNRKHDLYDDLEKEAYGRATSTLPWWTLPGKETLDPFTGTTIYIKDYATEFEGEAGKSNYKLSCISTDTKQHPDPVESRILTIYVAQCDIVTGTVPYEEQGTRKQVRAGTATAKEVSRGVVERNGQKSSSGTEILSVSNKHADAAVCTYTYKANNWIEFGELFPIPQKLGYPGGLHTPGSFAPPSDPDYARFFGTGDNAGWLRFFGGVEKLQVDTMLNYGGKGPMQLCKLSSEFRREDASGTPVEKHYFDDKHHSNWENLPNPGYPGGKSYRVASKTISSRTIFSEKYALVGYSLFEGHPEADYSGQYWGGTIQNFNPTQEPLITGVYELKCLVKYPPTTP